MNGRRLPVVGDLRERTIRELLNATQARSALETEREVERIVNRLFDTIGRKVPARRVIGATDPPGDLKLMR